MVFKIIKDKKVLETNPEISNFPKLSKCSDRELRWIFFVYDYDTPLRKMPLELRKEKAADIAGFLREKGSARLDKNARNTLSGKLPHVEEAISEFMEIQYDEDKDLILAYDTQISDAKELMKKKNKTDKEWAILVRLNKELPGIVKAKKDLDLIVGYRDEEDVEAESMEDEPLSALDLINMEEDF